MPSRTERGRAEARAASIGQALRGLECEFTMDDLAGHLAGTGNSAAAARRWLLSEGYIEAGESPRTFRQTGRGRAFILAPVSPPSFRTKAEGVLAAFVERATAINADVRYPHIVTAASVDGDFIDPTADKVRSLLVFVALGPRWSSEEQPAEVERFIAAARAEGRQFRSFVDQLFWPQLAVLRGLRAGSRLLQIFHVNEAHLHGRRIVLPQPGTSTELRLAEPHASERSA